MDISKVKLTCHISPKNWLNWDNFLDDNHYCNYLLASIPPNPKSNGFWGLPKYTAIRITINGITDKIIPRMRLFFAMRGSRSRIQNHEINPPAHPKNIGSNHQAELGLMPWLEYCGEYWGGGVNLVLT